MTTENQPPSSVSDQFIEHGKTYDHAEHGRVTVTGIWQRTQRLETVHHTDGQEMTVVRYLPAEDGEWIDERAEPLDDFLEAVN